MYVSEERAHYHVSTNHSDEIDLRELACTLWAQKALIIVCTVVITALAAAYAFLSTPVYETEVQTLPPPPPTWLATTLLPKLTPPHPR